MIRIGNSEYAGETYKITLSQEGKEKPIIVGRNDLKAARQIAANWEKCGSGFYANIQNINRPGVPVQTRSTFWNQK